MLVIGVPNEIGIPALYKGIFRIFRRFGSYDATIMNIFLSFVGYPPTNRPISEITPGFRYHFEHMGFDFRKLKKILCRRYSKLRVTASPLSVFGVWLMPEVYFTAQKS